MTAIYVTVWLLVYQLNGAPMQVTNIAGRIDCEILATQIKGAKNTQCIAYGGVVGTTDNPVQAKP